VAKNSRQPLEFGAAIIDPRRHRKRIDPAAVQFKKCRAKHPAAAR
jgi:hypothetical protein